MLNHFYLCLILILISIDLKGQNSFYHEGKYLELNISIGEVRLKPYFFNQLSYIEKHQFTFEIEGVINLMLNEKWFTQIGLQYSLSRYKVEESYDVVISNPNGAESFTTEFEITTDNSFGRIESIVSINIDQTNCTNYQSPKIENGDVFPISLGTWNSVDLIGLPIKIGRFIGKKNTKLYTSFSLIPKLVIRKNIDTDSRLGTGLNLGSLHRNNYCYGFPNERVERIATSSNIYRTKWNLNNSRLDAFVELGMIHKLRSNYLKIGVYYGESLTPYSDLSENNSRVQQMGLRFGFAIESFKKSK